MNTHPEKWYIQLTPENYHEVSAWWLKQVEQSDCHIRYLNDTCIVLSVHPNDNTYCWIGDESYLNKSYPSYKKITLEQFRQITKPMNTLPTKWYIEVTEENRDELDRWRQRVATSHRDNELRAYQHTILSRHLVDGSCYYANPVKDVREHEDYEDYQEITLEQFRQITKPMNTLPTNWYIQATEENHEELNSWRRKNATTYLSSGYFKVGYTLLSEHHSDKSCYYADDADEVRGRSEYKDYQEITLEQFRQITNSTQKPMTKSIRISRELLNEYYDAATTPQREYLAEHFKLDGTTTDEAIRGLHDLACSTWKPRIKKNHPDCFEDGKYFDFSAMADEAIVEPKVAQALGLSERFIEVRNGSNPKLHYRSFYLSTEYNWELVNDNAEGGTPVMVLIPTKK